MSFEEPDAHSVGRGCVDTWYVCMPVRVCASCPHVQARIPCCLGCMRHGSFQLCVCALVCCLFVCVSQAAARPVPHLFVCFNKSSIPSHLTGQHSMLCSSGFMLTSVAGVVCVHVIVMMHLHLAFSRQHIAAPLCCCLVCWHDSESNWSMAVCQHAFHMTRAQAV
jgi:hypothetical protein